MANGYKAFFERKTLDIEADTLADAKEKAVAAFKPSKAKRHMVHVHLCELDGKQVTHTPTE